MSTSVQPSTFLLVRHTLALCILVLLANAGLFLAVLIKPFSEKTAWELACWTAYQFWSYMQRHWENTLNAKDCLTITGDKIPENESAVVISNHLSYADFYLVLGLAERAGMMGRSRFFVKKEIVWQIPLFGISFWAIGTPSLSSAELITGMILVSRNWTNDERLIEDAFARIKQNKHNAWIVLYPEGTRRTSKKVLESQAFAREKGKSELLNVLLPRTKGFISTIKGLRDSHVKHLYDFTFLYTSPGKVDRVPTMAEQLSCPDLAAAGYKFQVDVKRIPIDCLPKDDEGLQRWCEDRWKCKDELLSEMKAR
ncbi:hypothetical protein BD324DRAFT_326897 [Kockovaella imperatae]|uniref:Phospholipid/glycerol acyltransferase domain-containing protein n=1 Tax=Kockovaella imperatae TaxID=4999 RepID=A0A1Y1UMS2_9TREE|nr:hypothetical protein BD324DRAFT_326897 [Kockovaella imperatae]ORX39351.1 hypothetical protein BD324DRAFT_326897 [Kockovaella imperatae]